MPIVESELALLRDPRLAALATSAWPGWLWSADASRILWANAVGAALFGVADPGGFATRRFDVRSAAAAQISRLAGSLPSAGLPRLERLRGFGLGFGRTLTCACSRIAIADGNTAILVAATEPAGPALTLGERVRHLFAHDPQAIAVFTPDGRLLHATAAAQAQLGGATTLSTLGIEPLAAKALDCGSADGTGSWGHAMVERLGEDASRVLVMTLTSQSSETRPEIHAPEMNEPAHAAPAPGIDAGATVPSPQAPSPAEPMAERRHPLRFVWQMDEQGRFVVGSNEFLELVGPRTTAAFGRLWNEIAAELQLDPDGQVARAIATHETWSGVTISWPVDETGAGLPVELSGLPVFDRDRTFRGYRGFGVCRDITRINQLARARRERPIGFMAAPEAPLEAAAVESARPQTAVNADTPAVPASPQPVEAAARVARSALGVAAVSANVVPFRQTPAAETKAPSLSPVERKAFRELAQELTARLRGAPETPAAASGMESPPVELGAAEAAPDLPPSGPTAAPAAAGDSPVAPGEDQNAETRPAAAAGIEPTLLDRLPIGILIYRHDALIYANRYFLEWTGYETLDELATAGGLNALFVGPGAEPLAEGDGAHSLSITTRRGDQLPVDGRMIAIAWNGASALALILANGQAAEQRRAAQLALAAAEQEISALKATLESDATARDKNEEEMRDAKREAQRAVAAKAEFLAKISHEIRTPLNAIAGFAEVIMAERFGPIGNERYREYLKDIHGAGSHLVSLLNDLLDLSKIETGDLELTFAKVALNDLVQQCVAIMQPQANRARIIIRTALTPALPKVVADERSVRQIVLNLLANSVRLTGPGGQVIVSTAVSDASEVVLRLRDTGVGMSEKDIEAALEPFRRTVTSGAWGADGTGVGLPLTKALAEANHANFSIKSAPNAGTLIEVAFPPSSVVAE